MPRSPHWDNETVQNEIVKAAKALGESVASAFERGQHLGGPWVSKSESPIEAVFFIWWYAKSDLEDATLGYSRPFGLSPQHEVVLEDGTRYRLDFAVPEAKIAIELDGHEFHERTKEQVIHRNERDRKLQVAGWTVLHFSGTELLRNPAKVATEVFEQCVQVLHLEPAQ